MNRCQFELVTETYFGLSNEIKENDKINVDFGMLVDFASFVQPKFIKTAEQKTPDYDGMYLTVIEAEQNCGTVLQYQKVIECSMNRWCLEHENENVIGWMSLPSL